MGQSRIYYLWDCPLHHKNVLWPFISLQRKQGANKLTFGESLESVYWQYIGSAILRNLTEFIYSSTKYWFSSYYGDIGKYLTVHCYCGTWCIIYNFQTFKTPPHLQPWLIHPLDIIQRPQVSLATNWTQVPPIRFCRGCEPPTYSALRIRSDSILPPHSHSIILPIHLPLLQPFVAQVQTAIIHAAI